MDKGKVSIIVPVYNSAQYLERCYFSISNQTYENIEILFIDDGSKDDSLALLRKFESLDSRVRVIVKPLNSGLSNTRNVGMDNCVGEFICFVDSDDCIAPDMVETLFENVQGVSVSCIQYENFTGKNPKYNKVSNNTFEQIDSGNSMKWLLSDNNLYSVCRFIFRKEDIEKLGLRFNESMKMGEDQSFLFDLFNGLDITLTVSRYTGYYYYTQKQSMSMGILKENHVDDIRFRAKVLALMKGDSNEQLAELHLYKGYLGYIGRGVACGVSSAAVADKIKCYYDELWNDRKHILRMPFDLKRRVMIFCLLYCKWAFRIMVKVYYGC